MLKSLFLAISLCALSKCCTVTNNTMTPELRASILAKHNQLRNKVASGSQSGQPSAKNIYEAVWDNELEQLAQNWVNTCPTGHNPNRNTASYSSAGENLYWAFGGTFDPNNGIQAWYDEVSQFSSSGVDSYVFSSGTGHYTQVIWHDSNKIGCAFAKHGTNTAVFACNYYKYGNIRGAKIYERGTPCSNCTCSTTYTSLCAQGGASSTNNTNTNTNTNTTNTNTSSNTNNTNSNPNNFDPFKKNGIILAINGIVLLIGAMLI